MSEWKKRNEQAKTRKMLEIAASNRGHHDCGTTGMSRSGSCFYIHFTAIGKQCRINIAQQCREKFGRLNAEKRDAIEAEMPETIGIDIDYITVYKQNVPYNVGNIRYLYSIDMTELNDWLNRVQL